jgi:ribonuclease P protein component
VRVAFVVSRKVGKAVVRNRVRRRLRESLRAMLRATPAPVCADAPVGLGPEGRWPASFDALVIVRPSAAEADYRELGEALRRALDQASAAPKPPAPKASSSRAPAPKATPKATPKASSARAGGRPPETPA